MKIAVIDIISKRFIEKFISKKIDAIIFFKSDNTVNLKMLSSQFLLINALDDVVKANWFNFKLVDSKIKKIKSISPDIFVYKGYDLESGLNKDLFWSFMIKYSLFYQVDKHKTSKHKIIYYNERPWIVKKIALLNRIFFNNHKSYYFDFTEKLENIESKILFRIGDAETTAMYGDLISKLGRDNIISFQSSPDDSKWVVDSGLDKQFSKNIYARNFFRRSSRFSLYEKIKLFLINEDPDFLNTLIYTLSSLYDHVDQYEKLFNAGVKKIIFNAGENEGLCNVMCAIAKKHNVITFNYMNGTKAKDPHNAKTYFDYWFMPDLKSRDLILSYNIMVKEQLPITGHLLEETAENYNYSGSLDKFIKNKNNFKIIALLTSKVFQIEKMEVISFLHNYLEKHNDVIVLVRKHPSETNTTMMDHDRIIQLPIINDVMPNNSLFDLFIKSDVVISFSSTVSYQASWFSKPSFNYEHAEKSRLIYVDNEKVFQINNVDQLEQFLNDFLYNGKKIVKSTVNLNVSDTIKSIIINS